MLIDEILKPRFLMEEAEDSTADNGKGEGDNEPTTTEPTKDEPAKDTADDKPFLGDTKQKADEPTKDEPAKDTADDKKADEQKAEPPSDEDYMKAFVKDEKLLGNEKEIKLDSELAKAVLPTAKECGLTPENYAKLANALAAAQVQQAKDAMKNRVEYFQKMKQESMRTYTPRDFEAINAGIDKYFKPGGTMNYVIRNSELGADPEFLALMKTLGEHCREDNATGATTAGSSKAYDPNDISGLAKQWGGK